MPISAQLLEILACPMTKAKLVLEGNWLISTDAKTRRRYPVKDDIPVMLIEESEEMNETEWREIMQRHHVDIHS